MESTCNEPLVVAIDFGTTYSGYAYSYKSSPDKVLSNTKWLVEGSTSYYGSLKTPTAILIKINDKLEKPEYHGFGYAAQDKYAYLVSEDEHKDYYLLDRFKMKLYSGTATSDLSKDTPIDVCNRYKVKAIELFSKFIEFLKNHFWESIEKSGVDIQQNDIRWILTVPAIWNDGAKQFMRECGIMAGLASSQLTIAYEPEAAALWCLNLQDSIKDDAKILKPGAKCIVIDAGGGTVDYTVIEVTDTKQLVVKHEPSGGPWGGTTVDNKFFGMFKELFGDDVFETLKNNYSEDYYELCRDFEIKKRNIKERVNFKIPVSLTSEYTKRNRKSFNLITFGQYSNNVSVLKDKLRIDSCIVKQFFEESCHKIIDHTMTLLRKPECKGIDTLLLVGGYFGSNILQQKMKAHFPKLKIIIPIEPELTVVKGAVLFGHNPKVIKERIARYTYGIDSFKKFDPLLHPKEKKEILGGVACCKDFFDIHVRKGQAIQVGELGPERKYKPPTSSMTEMILPIVVSENVEPKFATDSSCSTIGEMKIPMPEISRGRDRLVYAQMSFGETELTVSVTEENSGITRNGTFDFLGKM